MRKYILHALIISFVFFQTPTIPAASDVEEKIEEFKQAIRIDPDHAEAHYNLGTAYGKSGMYKDAIEAFKQAIRINPDFTQAHYNLGVVYGESGKNKKAVKSYKQAIRIDPDYAEAHYSLGNTKVLLKNRGDALEQCEILKSLDPELANELLELINKQFGE